jgi:hypothetical protein
MTGIGFCRKPLPALARSKLMGWALGGSDRGGQDKSRKVRPVGWVRNSAKSSLVSNIANVSCNLRFLAKRRRCSGFDAVRPAR